MFQTVLLSVGVRGYKNNRIASPVTYLFSAHHTSELPLSAVNVEVELIYTHKEGERRTTYGLRHSSSHAVGSHLSSR